jgi:GTP-binding protein
MESEIVAIIGRPNVGKSTLFNRLTGTRKAIVDEQAGVTRDRHYGFVEWGGRQFSIVDTGGYIKGSDDVFEDEIRKQVLIALKECKVVLFVVDVTTGITDLDQTIASVLRKAGKPVILVVNKVDHNQREAEASEFYGLGLGDYLTISSANGSGTGELLDSVLEHLSKVSIDPEQDAEAEEDRVPKLAIVGRPNVGKSSLLNALVGEERNIVTPVAGTTRDTIHTRYQAFGFDFLLVDTAGLRKKGKVHEDIEFFSVMRTIQAIQEANVCFLMLDAQEGIEAQDLNIFHLIQKHHKGLVILVNKWDAVEKDHQTMAAYKERILERIAPFRDVPILFVSALEKQRIHKALETALEVFQNRQRRIPTHELNEFILPIIENQPPPATKGKYIKIKFVTQLPTRYPSFAFFCNLPQYVRESYKRFLENKLRERYPLSGVPVEIYFRKK